MFSDNSIYLHETVLNLNSKYADIQLNSNSVFPDKAQSMCTYQRRAKNNNHGSLKSYILITRITPRSQGPGSVSNKLKFFHNPATV